MLKTRIMTALVLLAILLTVLSLDSFPVFAVTAAVFFAAAAWESFRLFDSRNPIVGAALWTIVFVFLAFRDAFSETALLFALCAAIWAIRLGPSLAIGLPSRNGSGNRLLNGIFGVAILGCFGAIVVLYKHSALYLLSAMTIVWIADIGAYFVGKTFGKHKLAPSISPGKSWEGVLGGWLAVLACGALSTLAPALSDTFAVKLQVRFGWSGFAAAMTLLVGASVVGDLFESQLKRRVGMKDSSNLLPGHGGVLDRIDALIPVLPLAVLFDHWL